MNRRAITATAAVIAAVALAAGCSHEQPPTPKAPAKTAARPAPPVARAPEPPPPAPTEVADTGKSDKEEVFFDFDSSLLRDGARPILQRVAAIARKSDSKVRIEGNCDEVGTTEYNMALGEHRARQAKDYLVKLGVPSSKIDTVS